MVRNQDSIQDLSSPYYVHPSDGYHSVSIKSQLNTSNYQAWARAMRRGLGGHNKWFGIWNWESFAETCVLPVEQIVIARHSEYPCSPRE
ncbi:hypothetical protein MTR_7g044880 [Medicago truncatula]|uniref:Retrotransposon Copia-like N-terminal domain-containing protein n=1 Tax=Medicago truncatula TaxID=3880 RepID=G7KTX7_MEDTR|nr:hypothetical protein MTR_7g044880 [Medicago truncatula]